MGWMRGGGVWMCSHWCHQLMTRSALSWLITAGKLISRETVTFSLLIVLCCHSFVSSFSADSSPKCCSPSNWSFPLCCQSILPPALHFLMSFFPGASLFLRPALLLPLSSFCASFPILRLLLLIFSCPTRPFTPLS